MFRYCGSFLSGGVGARLKKGKLADVIAMPGDPTAEITATERVSFAMKEGKIIRQGSPAAQKAAESPRSSAGVVEPAD